MQRIRMAAPAARPTLRAWLDDLVTDLRLALRQLRHAPGPTAFIVLTLAIGIGANVTMVDVIDRLLLRPPPGIGDTSGLARVLFAEAGAPVVGAFTSYPTFLEIQRDVTAFDSIAAFSDLTLPLGTGAEAREVSATLVSPSFFSTLRVRPALGRFFSAHDGFSSGTAPGGPAVVVISDGFWRRELGAEKSVLGRTVRVGKQTYTIIGIAPPDFRGLSPEPRDVWLPITVTADEEIRRFVLEDAGMSWLSIVARLRPGVAREVAEQQVTSVARRGARAAGARDDAMRAVLASVIRGRGPDAPREVKVALWLGGVAALVLLIACANVANLLLARAFVRRREIALRLTLGATRARLARSMLVDALLLAALGVYGVMAYSVTQRQREIGVRMALGAEPGDVSRMISRQGLALAAVGLAVGLPAAIGTMHLMRGLVFSVSPTDPVTLSATTAVLLVVAFLASWLPARRASRVDPAVALISD